MGSMGPGNHLTGATFKYDVSATDITLFGAVVGMKLEVKLAPAQMQVGHVPRSSALMVRSPKGDFFGVWKEM